MTELVCIELGDAGLDLLRGELAPATAHVPAEVVAGWRRELARVRRRFGARLASIAITLERSNGGDRALLTMDCRWRDTAWLMTVPLAQLEPRSIATEVARGIAHARRRATTRTSCGRAAVMLGPLAVAQWLALTRSGVELPPGTASRGAVVIDHLEQLTGVHAIACGDVGRIALDLPRASIDRAIASRRARGRVRRAVVFEGVTYRVPALAIGVTAWRST